MLVVRIPDSTVRKFSRGSCLPVTLVVGDGMLQIGLKVVNLNIVTVKLRFISILEGAGMSAC